MTPHTLRDRWALPPLGHPRVRFATGIAPGVGSAIAIFQVDGITGPELQRQLWDKHRVLTAHVEHGAFDGVRVAPSLATTVQEVDRFREALQKILG